MWQLTQRYATTRYRVRWKGWSVIGPMSILYDDNQSMLLQGLVRIQQCDIWKGPLASIAWLHEMFNRDESKMAADIYTKAFHDSVRWKHACMLANIFDQGDLDDPATLEALTPSHDAESGQRQAYGQVVDDVPAFSDRIGQENTTCSVGRCIRERQ